MRLQEVRVHGNGWIEWSVGDMPRAVGSQVPVGSQPGMLPPGMAIANVYLIFGEAQANFASPLSFFIPGPLPLYEAAWARPYGASSLGACVMLNPYQFQNAIGGQACPTIGGS